MDEKKKIGYLVSQYPFPRHAYLAAEIWALRQLGIEALVAAIRPNVLPLETLSSEDLAAARETFYVLAGGKLGILWQLAAAVSTRPRGCLRALQFALKYGHGQLKQIALGFVYLAEAVVAGRFFMRNGIRLIHSHYTSTVAWMLSSIFPELEMSMSIHGSGEFVDPYFCLAEKARACQHSIRVISQYGYDQLSAAIAPRDREKLFLSRLGIRTESFTPIEFRPTPASFRILFVGGTEPPRTIDVILRALAQLTTRFTFEFHIIGDGANCAQLKRLAFELGLGDRAIFHGWRSQDEIRNFAADIFVLSSDAEGIPVALMEAMCRKICCIASDVGGVSELVRHGDRGLLTKAGDVYSMSAALKSVMELPDLRRRSGENARLHVLAEYDLARNTAGFARLFVGEADVKARR